MSNSFNALREHLPVDRFSSATNGEDAGAAGESHLNGNEGSDESRVQRLTPSSLLGWVVLFGATVLLVVLVSYAWPLLPPSVKTLEFGMLLVIAIGFPGLYLAGRQNGIRYWEDWETVHLLKGETVTTKVGRVADSDGNDPLFEEMERPGFAGLNPKFRTVDDEFSQDAALMAKVDRRQSDGEYENGRGRLDHAYTGRGSVPLLGDQIVVRTRGVQKTEYAPGYEWTTEPPLKPDMAAARKLRDRDQKYRNDIVPSYEERMQTLRNRLEKLTNTRQDQPMMAMEEIPNFLESIGFYHMMTDTRSKTNGNGQQALAPEPDTDIDDRADDRMEEADE